ncbi:50S ribosomal protein L10 [Patulibacter sp.]|uniref:50S ribosomal protein L10 n=1 Tax=Patulibacter sp. TaxID=1912859 RepID=UPI002722F8EA|nr:50S ribosomal protein L10 [Patulibacter sp.]MDO9410593.1 50S ribosomal protein L10 [Patulibacter sp.]
MNRDQKTQAIAEIVENINASDAVLVVDYRGLSVTQASELRNKLREADATLVVAKNTLTGRAIAEVGESAEPLRDFLAGPTALMYVKGDVAAAAKTITTFAKDNGELPTFKGGVLDGSQLSPDEIQAIAKLPSRQALYGQLVGMVASPITGLARSLGGLLGGLAIALGEVNAKKESGEIPSGDAPAASAPTEETSAPAEVQDDTAGGDDVPAAENDAAADPAADESGASA